MKKFNYNFLFKDKLLYNNLILSTFFNVNSVLTMTGSNKSKTLIEQTRKLHLYASFIGLLNPEDEMKNFRNVG